MTIIYNYQIHVYYIDYDKTPSFPESLMRVADSYIEFKFTCLNEYKFEVLFQVTVHMSAIAIVPI